MTFTVKAFLYGPTTDVGVIKEVDVNKYNATTSTTKVGNTDVKPDPTSAEADDAYGYTITKTDYY